MNAKHLCVKTFFKLAIFFLFAKSGLAQAPSFNVYITNEKFTAANKYQFELWIKKTGTGTLEIANMQFGINVNTFFRNGSTITPALVPGSSMLVTGQQPSTIQYVNNPPEVTNLDRVNISARANPGCGFGTQIPDTGSSCDAPGIRIVTVTLTTSLANWPSTQRPNLDFNRSDTGFLKTKVSYYPQPCPSFGAETTSEGTFYDYNSVPVVCSTNPILQCSSISNISISNKVNVACLGDSTGGFKVNNNVTAPLTNGQVRYTITGGNISGTPFTIVAAPSPSTTNTTYSGLIKGTYTVKIERGSGMTNATNGTVSCFNLVDINLTGPTAPVSAYAVKYGDAHCYGETNGAVTVYGLGGSGAYKFCGGFPFNNNNALFSDLYEAAGTYSYQVCDLNGCAAPTGTATTNSVTVTSLPPILFTTTHTDATCDTCLDGVITPNASFSNNDDFIVSLYSADDTMSSMDASYVPYFFSGLHAGIYYVDIIDIVEGCSSPKMRVDVCVTRVDNIFICYGNQYLLPDGNIVNTSGTYTYITPTNRSCDDLIVTNLVVDTCPYKLAMKVFISDRYVGNDSMRATIDPYSSPDLADIVTIELRYPTPPYDLYSSSQNYLHTDGTADFYFPAGTSGNSYYLVFKHRNSITTWSKTPILFSSSEIDFDFTR